MNSCVFKIKGYCTKSWDIGQVLEDKDQLKKICCSETNKKDPHAKRLQKFLEAHK